jgi:hypothetical protein
MQGSRSKSSSTSGAAGSSSESSGESRLADSTSGEGAPVATSVASDDNAMGGAEGAFGHTLNSKSIPGGSK